MSMDLEMPELKELEPSKAEAIKNTFLPMVNMLEEFEKKCAEVSTSAKKEVTPELASKAKRIRLDIAKVRIEANKVRISQKEEYVRAGKAIDGAFNVLKWAVEGKENELKEIETHFQRLETERIQKITDERIKMIEPYDNRVAHVEYGTMHDDVWNAYFNETKRKHEESIEAEKQRVEQERLDKIEADKKAEEKRLQDIENAKIETQRKADEEKKIREEEIKQEKIQLEKIAREKEKQLEKEKQKAIELKEKQRLQKIADEKKHKEELEKVKKDAEAKKVQEQKELKKRQDNLENRQKIHTSIKDDIIKFGVRPEVAQNIVLSMIKGDFKYLTIIY